MPTASPRDDLWQARASVSSSSSITSENLSKVDWYSGRPAQRRVRYYNSDADEEGADAGKHASEADDDHEGVKEALHERRELKEVHGDVDDSSIDHQHPLLAPFPLPFVREKPSIAASKEAKKAERPYSGAIPRSGNILPHSGILLPHYKNKQHSGAHSSGAHHAHKGIFPIRGISLIPSHVSCQSLKGRRALDGEIEPSSPKVTCLGRVKIKQKYQSEPGKVCGMQAAAVHRQPGKRGSSDGVASIQDREEGPVRAALSQSTPAKAELRKSYHWGHKKDTRTTDHTLDAEAKVKKSIRKALMESKYHIKFHRVRDQSLLSDDAPIEFTSSQVESAIDLGRFPSEKARRMRELTKAMANFPTVGDLDSCCSGFVPQAPPANSLLLMRNSKSRAACVALGSLSRLEEGVTSTKMFDEQGDMPIESEHDEQRARFLGSNVKSLSGVDHTLGREMAMVDHTSFHPKTDSEIRLWQRRCIVRPTELDVGRPIAYS